MQMSVEPLSLYSQDNEQKVIRDVESKLQRFGKVIPSEDLKKDNPSTGSSLQPTPIRPGLESQQFAGVPKIDIPSVADNPEANKQLAEYQLQLSNVLQLGAQPEAAPSTVTTPSLTRGG